jgi:hypothetical protein
VRQSRRPGTSALVDAGNSLIDVEHGIADVAKTATRLLFESASDQASNCHRRFRWQPIELGLAFQHAPQRLDDRVPGERPGPGQHLLQDTAERPDVGPVIDGLAARLLRAHVRGRAKCAARPRAGQRRLG